MFIFFKRKRGNMHIMQIGAILIMLCASVLLLSACRSDKSTSSSDEASPLSGVTDKPAVSNAYTANINTPESTDSDASMPPTPYETPNAATQKPTDNATQRPTQTQTQSQSGKPTQNPTPAPTKAQTMAPTLAPTKAPATAPASGYNGNENFTKGKIIRFSHPSGFYKDEFTLKLEFDSSYTVYYTTNGNEPSTSSIRYSTGIKISDLSSDTGANDKVSIIRAAAYSKGQKVGETVTATYIVNKKAGSFTGRYANIAVVSISTNKTNLYGSTGIFTNYTVHGRESERPAHVEFFDSDGTAGFSVDAGIRVYGGTSRANPQKSLKLTARKEYDPDNGKFKYAMLPDSKNLSGKPVDKYDSFILRAGGNDTLFGDANRCTILRDALIHTLSGKLSNIAFQAYRPVAVYINGTYFGLYNLRDDTDNDYLEQHYGVPKDDVAIVAYGHENGSYFYKVDEGTESDIEDYRNMLSWIASNDMQNSANYKKACSMVDTDNLIKYVAVNVYANNRDWPHNNMRMWRYKGTPNSKYGQDGKWRFILKDIDFSWGWLHTPGVDGNVSYDELGHNRNVLLGRADSGDHPFTAAFASLMNNNEFRSAFIDFMNEMTDKYFSADTALAQIDKMQKAAEHEMSYVISNKWYTNPNHPSEGTFSISARSVPQWKKAVNTLKTYAKERPAYIKALMKELYG